MNAGSACTGVGGLDLGLERAGMRVAWQCEADAKCREVLSRHWPGVPCHPDLRTLAVREQPTAGGSGNGGFASIEWASWSDPDALRVDVFCGGFPCQDLSNAGRRAGLAGERSALFFDLARVAGAVLGDGGWFLVENVPGLLSSNGGRDFAVVLATLGELGFHDLAWRVLDSRYLGVPQRRRRVFILARRARGRCAAEVLLEPESGGGDFEAGGEARARVASTLSRGSSGPGVSAPGRRQEDDANVGALATDRGGLDDNAAQAGHVVGPLMRGNRRDDAEIGGGHFIPTEIGTLRSGSHDLGLDTPEHYPLVANTLTGEGHDGSEDGTGRQTFVASTLSTNPRGGGGSNGYTQARDLIPAAPNANGAGEAAGLPGRLDDPQRPSTCPYDPAPDGRREQQMGNAVTVNVAEWIGRRLLAHINAQVATP